MSKPDPGRIQALADELNAMSPAARLRLAAGLLELGRADTAAIIIRRVSNELDLALLLKKPGT